MFLFIRQSDVYEVSISDKHIALLALNVNDTNITDDHQVKRLTTNRLQLILLSEGFCLHFSSLGVKSREALSRLERETAVFCRLQRAAIC